MKAHLKRLLAGTLSLSLSIVFPCLDGQVAHAARNMGGRAPVQISAQPITIQHNRSFSPQFTAPSGLRNLPSGTALSPSLSAPQLNRVQTLSNDGNRPPEDTTGVSESEANRTEDGAEAPAQEISQLDQQIADGLNNGTLIKMFDSGEGGEKIPIVDNEAILGMQAAERTRQRLAEQGVETAAPEAVEAPEAAVENPVVDAEVQPEADPAESLVTEAPPTPEAEAPAEDVVAGEAAVEVAVPEEAPSTPEELVDQEEEASSPRFTAKKIGAIGQTVTFLSLLTWGIFSGFFPIPLNEFQLGISYAGSTIGMIGGFSAMVSSFSDDPRLRGILKRIDTKKVDLLVAVASGIAAVVGMAFVEPLVAKAGFVSALLASALFLHRTLNPPEADSEEHQKRIQFFSSQTGSILLPVALVLSAVADGAGPFFSWIPFAITLFSLPLALMIFIPQITAPGWDSAELEAEQPSQDAPIEEAAADETATAEADPLVEKFNLERLREENVSELVANPEVDSLIAWVNSETGQILHVEQKGENSDAIEAELEKSETADRPVAHEIAVSREDGAPTGLSLVEPAKAPAAFASAIDARANDFRSETEPDQAAEADLSGETEAFNAEAWAADSNIQEVLEDPNADTLATWVQKDTGHLLAGTRPGADADALDEQSPEFVERFDLDIQRDASGKPTAVSLKEEDAERAPEAFASSLKAINESLALNRVAPQAEENVEAEQPQPATEPAAPVVEEAQEAEIPEVAETEVTREEDATVEAEPQPVSEEQAPDTSWSDELAESLSDSYKLKKVRGYPEDFTASIWLRATETGVEGAAPARADELSEDFPVLFHLDFVLDTATGKHEMHPSSFDLLPDELQAHRAGIEEAFAKLEATMIEEGFVQPRGTKENRTDSPTAPEAAAEPAPEASAETTALDRRARLRFLQEGELEGIPARYRSLPAEKGWELLGDRQWFGDEPFSWTLADQRTLIVQRSLQNGNLRLIDRKPTEDGVSEIAYMVDREGNLLSISFEGNRLEPNDLTLPAFESVRDGISWRFLEAEEQRLRPELGERLSRSVDTAAAVERLPEESREADPVEAWPDLWQAAQEAPVEWDISGAEEGAATRTVSAEPVRLKEGSGLKITVQIHGGAGTSSFIYVVDAKSRLVSAFYKGAEFPRRVELEVDEGTRSSWRSLRDALTKKTFSS